jgi:hypothetical protein
VASAPTAPATAPANRTFDLIPVADRLEDAVVGAGEVRNLLTGNLGISATRS